MSQPLPRPSKQQGRLNLSVQVNPDLFDRISDLAGRLATSRHRILHLAISAGLPSVEAAADSADTVHQMGLFDQEGGQ